MTPRGRPVPAELEGYRAGLAHALALRRAGGAADEEGERALREIDHALQARRYEEAEERMLALDRRLRAATPGRELAQYPRGLVSYTPTDGPESPTPPEEDPVSNRLILIRRLADVRASQGQAVEGVLRTLVEADQALELGDRAAAKRLGEAAQTELEAAAVRPAPTPQRRLREA